MATTSLAVNETVLKFPAFEDIKVSTKTIIAATNICLDIQAIFNYLTTTDYVILKKKRGRKKKDVIDDLNIGIKSGSIITLDYQSSIKGVEFKKKSKKNKKFFRNALTIIMIIDDKKINFKVSRNGKFQITGCKHDEQAKHIVKFFWEHIKDATNLYSFTRGTNISSMFIPAMRNIDFSIGFCVDREKLSKYINSHTDYCSMLEASFGYTGVNIKFPVCDDISLLDINQIDCKDGVWTDTTVTYGDYLELMNKKDREKNLNKKRYTTFLVFHSGKVILSGLCAEYQSVVYEMFVDIIRDCYKDIKEVIDDE